VTSESNGIKKGCRSKGDARLAQRVKYPFSVNDSYALLIITIANTEIHKTLYLKQNISYSRFAIFSVLGSHIPKDLRRRVLAVKPINKSSGANILDMTNIIFDIFLKPNVIILWASPTLAGGSR
jgi:hypothetical protein